MCTFEISRLAGPPVISKLDDAVLQSTRNFPFAAIFILSAAIVKSYPYLKSKPVTDRVTPLCSSDSST